MPIASAQLSNFRQSPRKMGRAVSVIRGKGVTHALAVLDVMPKRAAQPLEKLLRSAVSNARGKGVTQDELVISKIIVGKGLTYKRSNPRARGSMALIRKKASHVTIELSRMEAKPKSKPAKKVAKKPAKKETAEAPTATA